MKNKYFIFILTILLSYACTNRAQTKDLIANGVIKLDVTSALANDGVAIENLVESIDKVIPLQQNTADAIVAEVLDNIVTDEYIYILDSYQGKGVVIFDIKGNFVTRIKKGGGPGEINQCVSFFYDYDNDRLFVNDFIMLKEYTKEGQYIRSHPIDYQHIGGDIRSIKKIPEGFFAIIQTSYENSKLVTLDSNMTILWETQMPQFQQELPKSVVRGYNGIPWIVRVADNDIYKMDGNSIKIGYHLSFNDFEHIVKKEYHGPDNVKYYIELMRNVESGKYIFHNASFCESENYLLLCMWNGHEFTNLYYNTKTKNTLKTIREIGSLFSVITGDNTLGKGDYFYGRISPDRVSINNKRNWNGINPNNLLSDNDLAILKNTKPDDNPIIIIYKLKSNFKR